MATVVRAEAKITAQNALRPGINSAISDLKRFRQHADQLSRHRAMEDRLAGIGNAMKAAAAGFVAYQGMEQMRRAVRDFAALDREMTRIGITGDNASPQEIAKGLSEMRRLAFDAAMPINTLKEGMDALTASGENFQRSMEMLPSIVRTAQASGSTTRDIANTSQAIVRHLGIQIKDLQTAQDIIVRGGELGRFELKDMSRYLPSMAPAAKAVGIEGKKGLAYMVAMLQVIRQGTGTAEEAAASASNIFQKMESEETANRFKKMGVDLRKEMALARKNGENLIETFARLTNKALKGDLSKIPQLFSDMEFARGMRALLVGMGQMPELIEKINNSQGAVAENLKKITSDTQATLDRFAESADRARQSAGGLISELVAPGLGNAAENLQSIAVTMERMRAAAKDGGIVGAIVAGAKDFKDAVGRDLEKRQQELQREADEKTLADMPGRLALTRQHADRHIRVNQDAIRKLESMPQSAERDQKLATLRRNLAGWQQSVMPNADEWDALRRTGAGSAPVYIDPTLVDQWRYDSFEAQRNRARMGQTGPLSGLPVPPMRQNSFRDMPLNALDDAVAKTEEVKTNFQQAEAAAKGPGAAFAASVKTGVDQAITELERFNAAARNVAIPGIGRGFPTGRSMSEVE
jgi:TP901 family phage tail tape measure protein